MASAAPRAVGWASGDGEHLHMQPGSFSSMALLDSAASTGLIHGMFGSGNSQLGRYVFEVRNAAVSGPALDGHVADSGGGDVVNGPVRSAPRRAANAGCGTPTRPVATRATGLANGTYEITAHPPAGSNDRAASTQATIAGADITAPDLALGPVPQPPPDGTSVESIRVSDEGIPVVLVGTSPALATGGCPNGTATFEITLDGEAIASGGLSESPAGSGQYSGQTGRECGGGCGCEHHHRLSRCDPR